MAGRHTLAVMPTGAGKSLLSAPRAGAARTAIVISPLIALMQDQVRSAESFGIRAAALTSASEDPRAIRDALRDGQLDLLYAAPERATTELCPVAAGSRPCPVRDRRGALRLGMGHDFRPDYRLLLRLLDQHRDVPRLALTATADKRTRTDILVQLGIPEA